MPSHEVTDTRHERGLVAVVGRLGRKEHHTVLHEVVRRGVRHEPLGRRELDGLLVSPYLALTADEARPALHGLVDHLHELDPVEDGRRGRYDGWLLLRFALLRRWC